MTTFGAVHEFKRDAGSMSAAALSWKLRALRTVAARIDRVSPMVADRLTLGRFLQPRRKVGADYRWRLPQGARRIAIVHESSRLTGWAWNESGPAVLLVHGWESHAGRMLPLVRPLVQQGYRVVAFDAPGHGLSPRGTTHVIDVGDAVQHAIEQHGPFQTIIAHSLGAAATSLMLARRPDLQPRNLVLLAPMRDLQQQLDVFAYVAMLSEARKGRLERQAAERLGLPIAQASTIEAVGSLRTRGLVVHDEDDAVVPYSDGVRTAEAWPGAHLMTTRGLGHRGVVDSATVIKMIVDFLAAGAPAWWQGIDALTEQRLQEALMRQVAA